MPKNSLKIRETSDMSYVKSNYGLFLKGDNSLPLLKALIHNSIKKTKDKIAVIINNKEKNFSVIDNGCGFPAYPNYALSKEPITLYINTINKTKTHINLGIIFCLSDKIILTTRNDKNTITYNIENNRIDRCISSNNDDIETFSTKVTCFPNKRLFNFRIDRTKIEEYLLIVKKQYPNIAVALIIDNKKTVIERRKKRKKRSTTKKSIISKKDPVSIQSNDTFKPKGKSFVECIYLSHMGDKAKEIGSVGVVYGRTENELQRRIDIVSSIPLYIDYLKESVKYLEDYITKLDKRSKEYKKVNSLITKIKEKIKTN